MSQPENVPLAAQPTLLPGGGMHPPPRAALNHARRAFRRIDTNADPARAEVIRYDNDEQPTQPVRVPIIGNVAVELVTNRSSRPPADVDHPLLKGLLVLKVPEADVHVPVDFVFLVDVSGSMTGGKLESAVAILRWVAGSDGASEFDRVSVVVFSDDSEVILPLTFMTDSGKAELSRVAGNMCTIGGTRIASALDTAAGIIADRRFVNPVTSVVLLSDGQDDMALRESSMALAAIGSLATLRSIGIGSDHDPEMLKSLSDSAFGDFAFAADGKSLANAIGNAIKTARTTVASRTASLQLWRSVDDQPDNERPLITKEAFGTLCAGETRYLPFKCTDEVESLSATLTYFKPGSPDEFTSSASLVLPVGDCAPADEDVLKLIEQHELRVAVADGLVAATKAACENRFASAIETLDALISLISVSKVADTEMSKGLLEDVKAGKVSCTDALERARQGHINPLGGSLAAMTSAGARHTTMRASGGAGATAAMYNTPLVAMASQMATDAVPETQY